MGSIARATKLLLVGSTSKGALEHSYKHAADQAGIKNCFFDPGIEERKYIKGGFLGRRFQLFVPLEAWIRKMNRDLVLQVRDWKPDIIFLFTNARVAPGALATIKAMSPGIKFVWIWPDPLLSLRAENLVNAPLIDLTATYSSATIPVFEQMGFKNVQWIPLAGDPIMHKHMGVQETEFTCDISFVGSWRPERERVMAAICKQFPQYRIEIHGNSWLRDSKDPLVRKRVLSKGLFEGDMARKFARSRININVIDDTNYPAANMRFFEIPITGGLELTSLTPELEQFFKDREHVLYYKDEEDVIGKVNWIMDNPGLCTDIRKAGHDLALSQHTYLQRLQAILDKI